jgi:nucleoside-specific channel-forming protein
MKKTIITLGLLLGCATLSYGEDYSQEPLKNDYKMMNIRVMSGFENNNYIDTYLEMEFGGRHEFFDFYGYVDIMNILGDSESDFYNGDNFFTELTPRFSIDGMTGLDLSIGPIKEWYIATFLRAGDNSYLAIDNDTTVGIGGLFHTGIGIGTDIELPWFGKTALNLVALHKTEDYGSTADGKWDGYSLMWSWLKPLHTFNNGNFIAYQGYITYDFGMNEIAKEDGRSNYSLQWYNGIYYHMKNIYLGYGIKYNNNFGNLEDGASYYGIENESTGVEHYFDITYKF